MDEPTRVDTAPIIRGAQGIDLQEEGSPGVLLLHGFGDTPQTLALLARRLHKSGYSLYAPLLPGHGRNMESFGRTGASDWVDAAKEAFTQMQSRHEKVSIVGLSMGAALAVMVASERRDLSALVLLAPYLGMPTILRLAAATHSLWEPFAREINSRDPRSVRDPIEREKNLAYGKVTGRGLFELWQVVRRARRALPRVTAPTLIVQSREDPRCAPGTAEFALRALGAAEKKLVWAVGGGHIITVDYGREFFFNEVESWLAMYSDGASAAGGPRRTAAEHHKGE
jgi:carboxylesterase